MEPFVAQLKSLCASHPTRAKWVFVPTHAIGRTLGDRLALGGTDWANLRFVTALDVALRMGAPFLVERGIDPSEEGLGPALIMRLLLGLPEDGGYFRPLGDQPQMAVALWSTVRELRMAGLRATDLAADAFGSPEKHAELVALLSAYESFLDKNRRGDVATVFLEAMSHPDWCPIQPADCWTEMPDVLWSPLQRRLIEAMPGERVFPAALELPGLNVPRRWEHGRTDRRAAGAGATLAFMSAPGTPKNPGTPGTPEPCPVSFFHAGGVEAEIEEVFRRIFTSGRSLDEVEIVAASPRYATLIWEKAIRYDWPVTLAQGIPGLLTRPGRALLALAEWIEDDFSAGRLRRMLESGDVRLTGGGRVSTDGGRVFRPGEDLTSGQAARLLVKAQAAWGRDTYRLSLGRLSKSFRHRATRDDIPDDQKQYLEERATQADALRVWIDQLIDAVPKPGADGSIDLRQLVQCARAFVTDNAARSSALDALAATSLKDALAELLALDNFRCPLGQALRFLRERVESVQVGADRPRPGHLYVSSFSFGNAALAARPLLFVVGLEEGRVFPAPFEDPILLDAERERISPDLGRSADRTDESVYAALMRLAAASAEPGVAICLSYSCRDLREYRPTYASWLMLQAFRAAAGQPAAEYKHLREHLGTPKSCVPEASADALSESRWWLRGVAPAGEAAKDDVLRQYPALQAGVTAQAARQSDAFTAYDGHVPEAGKVLDPCAGGVVSATQLEDAAECPFRHFLKRGLGVDAIEIGDRDRDVWLDPLLRGSLLHDLYATLLRRCREAKRRADVGLDRDWLIKEGQAELDKLATEMAPPSAEVRDRESALFLEDLGLFVEGEVALDLKKTPVGFEVSFGRGDDQGEPLAHSEPIAISIGGGHVLKIAGRIDRIDRVAPSTYEILDYKTGGYWPDDWKGTFAGGTRLQHALYGLAALELLKRTDKSAKVDAAEYYFSSAKGQQERKRIPAQPIANVREVLADLRNVIATGVFIHSPDERSCKWCHHGHACGKNAPARAAAKVSSDPALQPFRKLAAHE